MVRILKSENSDEELHVRCSEHEGADSFQFNDRIIKEFLQE